MSSLVIDTVRVGTYTSGTVNVYAHIVCDTVSDLPAPNDYSADGITLVMGSYADIIQTGDRYKMYSNGTWVLQPSQTTTQLSLTDYYDKTEIDTMLASYYTSAQTDTAINTAIMQTQYTNRGTEPADGTDILTLPVGRYFKSSAAQTLVNTPSTFTGQACVFDIRNTTTATGTRMRIDFYSCAPSNEPHYWFAVKAGTPAEWKPWIEMTGTAL